MHIADENKNYIATIHEIVKSVTMCFVTASFFTFSQQPFWIAVQIVQQFSISHFHIQQFSNLLSHLGPQKVTLQVWGSLPVAESFCQTAFFVSFLLLLLTCRFFECSSLGNPSSVWKPLRQPVSCVPTEL